MSGKLFVISAPSGAGKTTIVKKVRKQMKNVELSISCTTRPPREGERDGIDYHFLTDELFNQKVVESAFIEHTRHFGYSYGTLKATVELALKVGKSLILIIDTEGALQIRRIMPEAVLIFIDVPCIEDLEKRLAHRSTEDPILIQTRLSKAQDELAAQHHYDYRIVNAEVKYSVEILKSIIIAENHRILKERV